jgi:hypothetical protein
MTLLLQQLPKLILGSNVERKMPKKALKSMPHVAVAAAEL